MSEFLIFVIGVVVTAMVGGAFSLLAWGAWTSEDSSAPSQPVGAARPRLVAATRPARRQA